MRLDQRKILITGGASGIGFALAKALASTNTVVITGRDSRKLEWAQKELAEIRTVRFDVASENDTQAAVKWMADDLGGIDLLVNCAGVRLSQSLETTTDRTMTEEIATNFLGSARVTRAALPLLRQSGEGAVVFFSSALALGASSGLAVYAATKAAVHSLARSLRAELRDTVRVFDILPPWVDTELAGPFGRNRMTPRQVAGAIVHALVRDQFDVYLGPVKALGIVGRLAPQLADGILARETRPVS